MNLFFHGGFFCLFVCFQNSALSGDEDTSASWSIFIENFFSGTSPVVQTVKRLPTMQETQVQSLGQEDLMEKEMATHSSILAWKIPWTEEPGRLQSMGSQRVKTRLSDFTSLSFTFFFSISITWGSSSLRISICGSYIVHNWKKKEWELLLLHFYIQEWDYSHVQLTASSLFPIQLTVPWILMRVLRLRIISYDLNLLMYFIVVLSCNKLFLKWVFGREIMRD